MPFCSFCTVLSWLLLLVIVRPDDVKYIPVVVYKHQENILSRKNVIVIGLCATIVFLFATSQFTNPYFGDIGILSLIFIVMMFGTGILSEVN